MLTARKTGHGGAPAGKWTAESQRRDRTLRSTPAALIVELPRPNRGGGYMATAPKSHHKRKPRHGNQEPHL